MTSLTLVKPKVRYLTISDIHLGHDHNPAARIVHNLKNYILPLLKEIDLLHLDGDLTDKLIDCEGETFYSILDFVLWLMEQCGQHKVRLRVLEGTPSHDRRQSRLFESLASTQSSKGVDVKWINTLHVEFIPDLDLSILYVPDEFTSSTETTLKLVKELFKEQGIQQVDVAHMHGMFRYQMEGIPGKHDTHDEDEYLQLVRHYLDIGHVHIYSTYKRILAQGSFDRVAHGEEGPKGGILCTIRDNGSDYYRFIENVGAKIFKTIEIREKNLEKAIASIERQIQKLPPDSYVRIKASKDNGILNVLPDLRKTYPLIRFSKLSKEDEDENRQAQAEASETEYSVIDIQPHNVVPLILETLTLPVEDRNKLGRWLTALQSA